MYAHIMAWIGLGVLTLLCLPILSVQKLILEVSAWALRLGMIALLGGGAYFWFRPGEVPTGVSRVLNDFPGLLSFLPEYGSPSFALCLACYIVAALVPLLAVLDVSRKLTRRVPQISSLVAPASPTPSNNSIPPAEVPELVGVPILRPVERRSAAVAIATAGSHHAIRSAN